MLCDSGRVNHSSTNTLNQVRPRFFLCLIEYSKYSIQIFHVAVLLQIWFCFYRFLKVYLGRECILAKLKSATFSALVMNGSSKYTKFGHLSESNGHKVLLLFSLSLALSKVTLRETGVAPPVDKNNVVKCREHSEEIVGVYYGLVNFPQKRFLGTASKATQTDLVQQLINYWHHHNSHICKPKFHGVKMNHG